ncbi:MAG: hypothetical protein ACOC4E_01785 [Patescibacteria group bacterium]
MTTVFSRRWTTILCGLLAVGILTLTPLATARAADFGFPSLWHSIVQQFNTIQAQFIRFGWWSADAPGPTEPAEPSESVPTEPDPDAPATATTSDPVLQVLSTQGLQAQLSIAATFDAEVTPCGPISFGTIDWGDGESEAIYGLGCAAPHQTLSAAHTYAAAGTYSVMFVDQQGGTGTAQVTVTESATNTAAYDRNDVVSIATEYFDDSRVVDEEYTLITLTLRDESIREVRAYAFAPRDGAVTALQESGFTGDANAFLAEILDEAVEPVQSAPAIDVAVNGRTVTATISGVVDLDCLRGPCVEGPIVFGDMAWGDGSTDRVSELSGKPASITHEYESPGAYAITFTSAETGERLTEAVLIR